VGLGIDLKHRVEQNLSISTQLKILASLLAYLFVTIGSFVFLIKYVKGSFIAGVEESLRAATRGGVNYANLVSNLDDDVTTMLYGTIAVVTLITVSFGILITRLALSPLRDAFKMQKSFISGIAHEIRTPLSILRMNNEIAKFDIDDSSPMGKLLDENLSDIDKINEILNNLLLFDRMGSLDLLRIVEKNDLLQIAKEVATQFRELAAQKKISIFITGDDTPAVIGNRTAIEQVFFNLLKNAMMYSQSGGRITIAATDVTDDYVSIRVSDTGVGIPQKDLPRIFEPFYRSEKTGKLSGTGIGLAIVLEIMKMHKGTIEVESIEGVGTSFKLTFPIREVSRIKRFLFNPVFVSKLFFDFSNKKR
jgi:signal transduction histidine kinase